MKTKRQKRVRKQKIFLISLCFLLLLILLLFITDKRLRTLLNEYSISRAEVFLLETTDNAVIKILKEENIDYNSIVKLGNNENGEIRSLEIDTVKVNMLKSKITSTVGEMLKKNEEFVLSIPIGTIIGNEYTVGRGPEIKFKMKLSSTAKTNFTSHFTGAGINQVLHRIVITVDYQGYILIPWYRSSFSQNTNYIAAETVIVGIVPDAFTNVIEGNPQEIVSDIFDYSAQLN